MKKITMICMSALLLLAVSCKKDKNTENDNTGRGLRVAAETHAGDSKTHLDGAAVKWDLDDEILVLDMEGGEMHKFKAESDDGNVIAFFEPAAGEDVPDEFYSGSYIAFYPSDCCEDLDYVSLPDIQTYAAGTFALNANPMIGASKDFIENDFGGDGDAPVCEDADITFFNFCGLLKLQLYAESDCTVKSIALTTNKEGEMLWGKGQISVEDYNEGSLIEIEEEDGEIHLLDGGNTLTLDCGTTGVSLSVDEGNPTVFYFVVPPLALTEGFTVKVTDTDGNVWTKTTAKNNQIYRSKVTVMPKLAVTTAVSPSEVTVTASCSNEDIYTLGGSVTVPEGEHTCEFGLVYSETDNTPTIEEGAQKVIVGTDTFSGTQSFTADITGLTVGTTYHVRAYAMIDGVTYSTGVKDIVGGDGPQPMNWTNGRSPKLFTVASGKQVYFSQGNLQYMGSTGTWRFAEHQFDFIGADNRNAAQNYTGWIDLFGWGTSGYHQSTDLNNVNYQPWATSTSEVSSYNRHGYGPSTNVTPEGPSGMTQSQGNISGSYYDWGVNCAISNGGNQAGKWRTLTGDSGGEWDYLINSRTDADKLYGEGKVGSCTPGLIILPDDWKWEGDVAGFEASWKPGKTAWSNVYSYSEWAKMEAAGAVFLPAAGSRQRTSVYDVGSIGYYWSSSYKNSFHANLLIFNSGNVNPGSNTYRSYGHSVRLVSEN